MEHNEFVERVRSESILWGVQGFYRPVLLAWGMSGLLSVLAASLLALVPALGFGGYCVLRQEHVALAWALPTVLAFFVGQPGLNCIAGLPWALCAAIGFALSFFFGQLHLVGGLLPGITWIVAGAVKGTTMASMESRLLKSAETYRRLHEANVLILHRT